MECDVAELAGVLWHEVEHLLRMHHYRMSSEPIHYLRNMAGDFEINDDIQALCKSKRGSVKLPESCLLPSAFKFDNGLLAEDYLKLLRNPESGVPIHDIIVHKNGDWEIREAASGKLIASGTAKDLIGGSGADGQTRSWELGPEGGINQTRAEQLVKRVASEMQEHFKTAGDMPGGMERWVDSVLNRSKKNWKRELQQSISNSIAEMKGNTHESYAKYNRRNGRVTRNRPIIPKRYAICPNIAIVIDTSGSMDNSDLVAALSECQAIFANYSGSVTVITGDTEAGCVQTGIRNVKAIRLIGGGGTDMANLIKYAETKLRTRPDIIIVLTDGYTDWPEQSNRNGNPKLVIGLTRNTLEETRRTAPASARIVELFN
jgi:predicted metal-dependent peptidase